MRRLLYLIPLLCCPSFGAIAHVAGQTTTCHTLSGASVGCAPAGNVTLGNTLILECVVNNDTHVITPSDTFVSTWNLIDSTQQTTDNTLTNVYWAHVAHASGADTLTCGSSGATDVIVLAGDEYSGVATASAVDVHTACTGLASVCTTSGNVTTTVANDALIGYASDTNAPTYTAGASYTLRAQQSWTGTEDQIGVTVGTYSASFGGVTGTDHMVLGIFALKPLVTGSPATTVLPKTTILSKTTVL